VSDSDDPLQPFTPRRSRSRVLSIVVVAGYLFVALKLDRPTLALRLMLWSLIPVLSIWFPTETSSAISGFSPTDYDPPERLILWLAWIALTLPIWVPIVAHAFS
jgi:hypothetical protein